MRSKFPHYVNYTPEQFKELWEKATIVLDTNVLLEFLRLSEQPREETFKLFEKLKDRLWIPYQVGLEFNRRKDDVCKDNVKLFEAARSRLQINIMKFSVNDLGFSAAKNLLNGEKINKIILTHNENIDIHNKAVEEEINCQVEDFKAKNDSDGTIKKILDLLDGKVGEPPNSQKELDEIYTEGEVRFNNQIPPGYKDKNKSDEPIIADRGLLYKREYGDLILWKQIISHAEKQKIKHVIFVTNDQKEDWWQDSNGKKEGPRKELISEIVAIGKVKLFHMYTLQNFLKFSREQGSVELSDSSLKEIGDLSEKQNKIIDLYELESGLFGSYIKHNKRIHSFGYLIEQKIIDWYSSLSGVYKVESGLERDADLIVHCHEEKILVEIINCISNNNNRIVAKKIGIRLLSLLEKQSFKDNNRIDYSNFQKIHISAAVREDYYFEGLFELLGQERYLEAIINSAYKIEVMFFMFEDDGSSIKSLETFTLN